MKWKFWRKGNNDETTLEVKDIQSTSNLYIDSSVYVKAQTRQKALELYTELQERKKEKTK